MRDYSEANSGTGYLRANTVVEVTDIFGKNIIRRVNIGRAFGVTLQEAQSMVAQARERNQQYIQAEFKISL
jgi:hypothetical protein